MRGVIGFTAAALFVSALAAVGPSQAAVYTTGASFFYMRQVDGLALASPNGTVLDKQGVRQDLLLVQPFDAALGTVSSVRITLSSKEILTGQIAVFGHGFAALNQADWVNSIQLGGQAVGGLLSVHDQSEFDSDLVFCGTVGTNNSCASQDSIERTFSFDVLAPSVAPFLSPSGTLFEPTSFIHISAVGSPLLNGSVLAAAGLLTWYGDIHLDYTYEPTVAQPPGGVPEPGTWALLIAGFGLCGATLRQRRAGGRAIG